MQVLLSNATIVDADRAEPREGHVLIEDGIIRDLDARPVAAPDRLVLDLRGRTLMPGLIDCHVHVVAHQMNLTANAQVPDATAVLRSLPIMRGMLDRGFTTVRDLGGAPFDLAEAIEAGLAYAPRLIVCGKAISKTGGHTDMRPRYDTHDPNRWARQFRGARPGRRWGGRGAARLPAGAAPGRAVHQDHGQWRRREPDRPDRLAGLLARRDAGRGRGGR